MAAAATSASTAVTGMYFRSPPSFRMSLVPASWSMIPAFMKSDALKAAWFMMWRDPPGRSRTDCANPKSGGDETQVA